MDPRASTHRAGAVTSIAAKIGCHRRRTMHDWVKKAEVIAGQRAGGRHEMAAKR